MNNPVYTVSKKFRAGIIGATGMVGQRFITLLENHPYFETAGLAASGRSAGMTYGEAVEGRWKLDIPCPENIKKMVVHDASDVAGFAEGLDLVFCAVNMKKDEIKALEEAYAKAEVPVISNNSANRWTPDVPMVIPEINDFHLEVIETQRKRLGTKRGFIAVKPNCSIQSYVPMLAAIRDLVPTRVVATTYQAISGAGKTFREWPEMIDNVIPYIGGEEEKSEKEPLRIFGSVEGGVIIPAASPLITTQCIRVPVTNGHTASLWILKRRRRRTRSLRGSENFPASRRLSGSPAHRSISSRISTRTTARSRRLTAAFTAAWAFPAAGLEQTRCLTGSSSGFPTTP